MPRSAMPPETVTAQHSTAQHSTAVDGQSGSGAHHHSFTLSSEGLRSLAQMAPTCQTLEMLLQDSRQRLPPGTQQHMLPCLRPSPAPQYPCSLHGNCMTRTLCQIPVCHCIHLQQLAHGLSDKGPAVLLLHAAKCSACLAAGAAHLFKYVNAQPRLCGACVGIYELDHTHG
mgnify:CR=1 FL=1